MSVALVISSGPPEIGQVGPNDGPPSSRMRSTSAISTTTTGAAPADAPSIARMTALCPALAS